MGRRRRGRPLHGWLIIDKEAGATSARVVAAVRRITGAAKAGHAGTLDPIATGVLPVALGEATKIMSHVTAGTKSYRFTMRWGEARDTDDAEGTIIATDDVRPSDTEIAAALPAFVGDVWQVPPTYSAIKVGGRRAYDLAREGEAVDLPARLVRVDRFELVSRPDPETAVFEVDCGPGAYVRALVRDLAARLGGSGHVTALRRTRVGRFDETAAISLAKLEELWQSAPPAETLLPVETALVDIPALALTGPQADRLCNGQVIRVIGTPDGTVCAMNAGRLVALAQVQEGEVRPLRVFNL